MMLLMTVLTTATAWAWEGSGTSAAPYQITNANDLEELANSVNNGTRYANKYFLQTADITVSGSMKTIGTSNPFCGHYDGGSFTIFGLTHPLFGTIQRGEVGYLQFVPAEVKNLTISGAEISTRVTGGTIGILAIAVNQYVSITNCHVKNSTLAITGVEAKCGGLIGSVTNTDASYPTTVSGCSVTATSVSNNISGQYCGGLFGYLASRKNVYDNYADATLSGDNKGGIAGLLGSTATPSDYHDNYYHAAEGLTAAIPSQADNGEAAVCALIGVPGGVTIDASSIFTHGGKNYYAPGTINLTIDDADKTFISFSVSGATYSLAADRKSATVTLATSDATVSAALSIGGSCGDDAVWMVTDEDGDSTYETLTISGSGAITSSPWDTGFAASIRRVNISSTDLTISGNPFSTLSDEVVIVVPTPAYAVSCSSAAYASQLRAALGSYFFDIDGTTAADAAYKIATEQDLRNLAAVVNATENVCSGKTFRQTADITVSTMVGTSEANSFQGTYDGGGHTLTFNATAEADGCAPFRYIRGATIKCLKVAGTVSTGYKYAAGIAAHSYGTCTIQNCQSSIAVNSTISGDGTHAGFVAVQENGTLTITNCLMDGSITGSSTTNCGGFVGWRNSTLKFTNCLMAGTMAISQTYESALFNRNYDATLTNCYYDGTKSYGEIWDQDATSTTATGSDLKARLGSRWQVSGDDVVPIMDTKNLAIATLSGISHYYIYTGNEIPATYTVTAADGNALTKGTHYTATITKGGSPATVQDMGDYTLTVSGTGDYTGSQTFNFTVSNYINMPTTGTKEVTIPSGVTSFKVYDDGGPTGNYRGFCDGTLVLTAPEGYVLQLTGYITTDENWSELTVYDSDGSSKQIDELSGTNDGSQTAISPIVSSGQSMTISFYRYSGNTSLDLTVTLASTNKEYDIAVNTVTGGSVACSVGGSTVSKAKANDVVTLTATPASGYLLRGISVVDANSNAVSVTGGCWYNNQATFTMPASEVTVTPSFTNDLTGLSVNMPTTGTKEVTIPAGVTSFKVYDDGGPADDYSYDCNGTLVLTAPEGSVLQLSGSITTMPEVSYLTVYDSNGSTKLLNAVCGNQTITNVRSSGKSMTLLFYSETVFSNAGLDLTVTVFRPNVSYDIMIVDAGDGNTVTASVGGNVVTKAKYYDAVTLTATPASGYLLSELSVVDANGNAVRVPDMRWYTGANTATFTMPTSEITVTPTFTNTLTADGGLYINMPTTDTKKVTIPSGVQSFKVYDDGGPEGNYSLDNYSTLVLTAPAGYALQLSGSITTHDLDYLTVYDSDGTAMLLDDVSGTQTITTVTSSGQSMTIYFESFSTANYAGLDLTVTLVSSKEYNINVNTATGGSVACSVDGSTASKAWPGDVVTLTAAPASGYLLRDISVVNASSNAVSVTGGCWYNNQATFTMPASEVTVTPSFTNDLTNLSVNMPTTGTKEVAIPAGVTSFKVYDYSEGCDGTLVLTAPEGYVLQLSGSIKTDEDWSNLTVYDSDGSTKQLDAVSGPQTITTVTSSGQSMTIRFYSGYDYDNTDVGLDLTVTVTLISTIQEYNINVNTATSGSVTCSIGGNTVSKAKAGNTVTLTATPASGYLLRGLSVVDANSNAVSVTGGCWYNNQATFNMPASEVTVTPSFTNDPTDFSVNMPTTGTKEITIPSGVQSFKVYGDGDSAGNYLHDDVSLVLTAPTGYALQLSGSIKTDDWGNLTVYDSDGSTKLLDKVRGARTITTVTSSGQSMTIYFYSSSDDYDLDLTVTLIKVMELADAADNTGVLAASYGNIAKVTLSGRTLYKDGDWNTLCLPFDVTLADSPLAGATVMKLNPTTSNLTDGTLTLNFDSETTTLHAGTPYIIKWTKADGYIDDDAHNLVNPVFNGVTIVGAGDKGDLQSPLPARFTGGKFMGSYDYQEFTQEDKSILFLGAGNTLYWPQPDLTDPNNPVYPSIGACRAYFQIGDGATVRSFRLNFGDGNGSAGVSLAIVADEDVRAPKGWYSLDGRRLDGKPQKAGLYIHGGKKVVIK